MVVAPPDNPGMSVYLSAINNTAAMKVGFEGRAGALGVMSITTNSAIIQRNQWNRVVLSGKQSTGVKKIVANGANQAVSGIFNTTPAIISSGLGSDECGICHLANGSGGLGGNILLGAIYRPWFDFGNGAYFDAETNEVKFWDASGHPAVLGPNGEAVTGSSPKQYLPNGPEKFNINKGTTGNFTMIGSFTGIAPPT